MCLTKIETNLHYLFFRLIIVNLRAFGPLFVIRQVIKLRAAIFVLCAGNDVIAVQINTDILEVCLGKNRFCAHTMPTAFLGPVTDLLGSLSVHHTCFKYGMLPGERTAR